MLASQPSGTARPGSVLLSGSAPAQALLLTENVALTNGPPLLLQRLTVKEREEVLKEGQRRVVYRGKMLFSQGSPHDGIFLIESGRIRVFYIAPSGREITLAYWHAGNFVGGPELFGQGTHVWSGVAASNSVVLHLTGKALRGLITRIPALSFGLIEGLTFKGKCYSALAQMLGTAPSPSGWRTCCFICVTPMASRRGAASSSAPPSPMPTWPIWWAPPASG